MSTRTGDNILGAPLWLKASGIFREWVKHDDYGGNGVQPRFKQIPTFQSVWELVSCVINEGGLLSHPTFSMRAEDLNMDMTIKELLSSCIVGEHGRSSPLEKLAVDGLCIANISALLTESSVRSTSKEGQAAFDELVAKSGYGSWETMYVSVLQPGNAVALAQVLMQVFWEETGDRALWSYFKKSAGKDGYRTWWPGADSGAGRSLNPHSIATNSGQVTVRASSYSDMCEPGVMPYEWCAEMHLKPDDAMPDAIAYGMVYVMPRDAGELMCDDSDLRWASDAVSDTDVAQVLAFFRQQIDAHELMEQGDLCFVWLWERREGTPKGIGSECLLAALEDIKKRFRSVRTVIVNLRPGQFTNWGERNEPAVVQVAKQEALEQLEYFVRKLAPQKKLKKNGQLRFIIKEQLGELETLAALGSADRFEGKWGQ